MFNTGIEVSEVIPEAIEMQEPPAAKMLRSVCGDLAAKISDLNVLGHLLHRLDEVSRDDGYVAAISLGRAMLRTA